MEKRRRFKIHIPKRTVSIVLRVIVVVVALYLLLLAGISIYVSSSQQKLIGFVNENLRQTFLGELRVDKADISVWRTFPNIGITLSDVSISDSFYHKPFLRAGEITGTASFFGLIGNKVKIRSIAIEDALIHSFTDAQGYSNTYVLRSKGQTQKKSNKPLVFKKLSLENVIIVIEDGIKKKRYAGRMDDVDIDASLSGSKYHITMDGDIFLRGLGFNFPQGYWMENQQVSGKWKLEYDTSSKVLSINESKIEIQSQPFIIKGKFDFKQSQFNIDATTKDINYAAVLSILKPKTRAKLSTMNLTEPLDVTTNISGPLDKKGDPLVHVDFKTENNNITTPVVNLNNCNFSGSFINQTNAGIAPDDSNSTVTITGFTSKWADIQLNTPEIVVTNIDRPVIKFEFYSQCTLPQLDEALGSATLSFVEGNAKLYLAYNGPLVPDPYLLNLLNAEIEIENGKVDYLPRDVTFSDCNGKLYIIGNKLTMHNFKCDVNTNHFTIDIDGKNLNRLSDKEPGKADIDCNIYSPAVNIADFRSMFGTARASSKKKKSFITTFNAVDDAMENGAVNLSLKAQQLSFDKFRASNVIAALSFNGDGWEIQKAYLQHADGSLDLSAKVHYINDVLSQASIQMNMQHINVKKLFYAFNNFGQTSLTYANINGVLTAKANIVTDINHSGKLIPSTINGKMEFSLKDASLINFKPILEIQKYVLKNRDLNNIQFTELTDTFDIKNGDIYIHRMPVISSALTMYLEGIYSFEDRTDILIQIPFSSLKSNPDDFRSIDKDAKPGKSINLRARTGSDGQLKIGLDIFNKYKKEKRKQEKKKKKAKHSKESG
jgi:hypothetical protein